MFEKSLIILKPDVVARGVIGEIVTRFERIGLKIIAMKMMQVPQKLAEKHYEKDDEWLLGVGSKLIKNQNLNPKKENPMHHGKKICDSLARDLTIYPVVAMVVEGHNTIKLIRKMVGEQSPENSAPGTIRGDYSQDTYILANASDRPVINLIHASDSKESAEQEIKLWFKKEELIKWKKPDEVIHFRGHKR
ncbi:MAG: nucleoside-diphosphate kinase [Nanoarchaeota archaeon]|nr:nucleoside-diphosphate kinase [Nanoarchaeota archaeon]MBU1269796.1 nucleoside-diphosphate kinase [Nanoarchaeota archaeon]MBU1604388.1 nucleoside-diphosphate kinase [Nanoarchaeota archaeon]MBU2443755.1 nucleoside-diphosphate kinase [Nanoarchaeota archaeon]